MTAESDDWLKKAIEELVAKEAVKEIRRQHPYVIDLIEVLKPRPHGRARKLVLHTLEKNRQRDGLPIPPKFKEAVQSVYNRHCIDSLVFKKRKAHLSEGLFYSLCGMGSGAWAVHPERAAAWLKRSFHFGLSAPKNNPARGGPTH
ncbi:MAG: hypothetical protein O3A88_03540 [Proteobacteria bacterium]|nr:hypothetical protein [Pseudomonadota bacterium]